MKSIHCDKFVENGKIRPPITFKRGLNTVLGDEVGSNSIGKSTFLMIIDFVFGGDDYIRRLIDVQDNVGPHTINFTFEFEDGLHYFSRATGDAMNINVYNEHYQVIKVLSKDEYNSFLSQKFKLNSAGLTLRGAASRFFRVYGRETLDPKYPLQAAIREPIKASIEGLLKLFDRYQEIEKQKHWTEQAKSEEEIFKKAQKYDYLPSVTNKVKYQENEKRIVELEVQIQHLIRESSDGFVDLKTLQMQSSSELKQQLKVKKRKYISLTNELNSIELDRIKRYTSQKDYNKLKQFFPEVNEKSLEEIEDFHKKLAQTLKDEFKESATNLQEKIDLTAKSISQLEAQLTEIGNSPNVTHAVLNQHRQKQKELELLRAANRSYDTIRSLTKKRKELENQLNELVLAAVAHTQEEINTVMNELNQLIYKENRTAPCLVIKDAMRYSFSTPNDRGTGSQYKGLILFDLVALKMTNLPLLVHDSVLLKQIEDGALEEILKLYTETEKQIFIALDKKGSFSEKAQNILQETAVLNLYPNAGALFGHAWNKR